MYAVHLALNQPWLIAQRHLLKSSLATMAYSSAPKPCTTTQISLTSTPIHQVPASHDLSPSPSGLWNGPHWHSLAPWHISQGRTSDLQGPLLSQETTFRRCLCHQVYVCENRQTDGSGWTSTATLPSEQACLPSLHSMCVPDSQQGFSTLSLSPSIQVWYSLSCQ